MLLTNKETDYSESEREQLAKELAKRYLSLTNERSTMVYPQDSFYTRYGKRMVDVAIALPAFLVTLPINALLALCTRIDVGSPIMFHQERVGKDGVPFVLVKFRNMRDLRDEKGELLPPKDRVTRFGSIVRRTSLDELLNLWSILKGDMSIIGPRPLPMEYADRYSRRHNCRHAVRPGLECPFMRPLDHPATWEDQFENDIWYVENVSFKTDITLFLRLFMMVFERKRSKQRSVADRGSFLGYDENGHVVTTKNVHNILNK